MDDKVTQVCIIVLNQHASYLIQLSSESCSFIWPTMNHPWSIILINASWPWGIDLLDFFYFIKQSS